MRNWSAILLLFSLAAHASKPKANDYQDGTLVAFRSVTDGASCHTSGAATTTSDTTATTSADTDCSNTQTRWYTVQVAENTFVIKPVFTKKKAGLAVATMGWSAIFAKQSVLSDQLPGSHFLIRSDADGMHIKIGKRESLYRVVAAQ